MDWKFLDAQRLWWLVAVAALVVGYIAVQFRRRRSAVRFSNVNLIDKIAPKSPGWKRHLVAALHLCALAVLVTAYARPQNEQRVPRERTTIILAIDTSLSMYATDVDPSRIESAKSAAVDFVESVPANLQLGVVSFNGSTSLLVPPTTNRRQAVTAIDGLELGEGTAIGDAVNTSLKAIASVPADSDGERPPAVIVLLSDGMTTVGTPTEDAIQPALDAGVPVYTIAFGTADGYVEVDDGTGTGNTEIVPVPVDTDALGNLAEQTHGQFFEAASTKDLTKVYEELGSSIGYDIERVEITAKVLGWGLGLLALSSVLSLWWYQRLP
ncbi:MAG: VWA domain-containing protein [Microthrixaceae bacterium]|nr:VWA domain-containing protein [Microthrixaceae bacterium]